MLLPACTAESVVEDNAKADTNGSAETKPTAADNPNIRPAALEQIAEEAKGLLESLLAEFEKAQSRWMKQSPDERRAFLGSESRPSQECAEKLVELAEKYPDTEAAKLAWPIAVKIGLREPKTTASQAILAAAIAEPDPAKSMKSLEFLMKYSFGGPQKEAIELMLSRAMEHKNPESAFNIIKKIVTSSTSLTIYVDIVLTSSKGREIRGDMLLCSGNRDVKQKAIQQLLAIVDSDVKSDKAVKCLNLIYENSYGETRDNAIAQLLEHHPARPQTMEFVRGLGRYATVKNENFIKQAMSSADEKVKTNAAIALCHLFWKKQLTAQHHESAPHDAVGGTKNAAYQAYLEAKPDPADLTRVEEMLTAYIETHHEDENDDMVAAAKNGLFAMQNLVIGKHVPEIAGEDLNGVEFKLSDYRGQIVFLNFWGDW